jgi:hypothetical protein
MACGLPCEIDLGARAVWPPIEASGQNLYMHARAEFTQKTRDKVRSEEANCLKAIVCVDSTNREN